LMVQMFYQAYWDPNVGSGMDANPLVEHRLGTFGNMRLRNDWFIFMNYNHAFPFFDDAETRRNPMVRIYSRQGAENFFVSVGTNPSKPINGAVNDGVNYDHLTSSWINNLSLDGTVLAASRLQLGLHLGWQRFFSRPRWITTGNSGLPLF